MAGFLADHGVFGDSSTALRSVPATKGNAVKDICSRIRQNLDFFELDQKFCVFGDVDHPVLLTVQIFVSGAGVRATVLDVRMGV